VNGFVAAEPTAFVGALDARRTGAELPGCDGRLAACASKCRPSRVFTPMSF